MRKIILAAFTALALLATSATAQVAVDSTKTGIPGAPPFAGTTTYSSLVAATPCTANRSGFTAFVTDWGANGTSARCNGSRWLPSNGQTVLKRMGAAVSGIGNTETIVAQVQMPPGTLQAGDSIVVRLSANKSGSTDNITVYLRVGTAGTVADTPLTGMAARSAASTTNVTAGQLYGARIISNTSAQTMGMNASNFGSYGSSTTVALSAVTTGLPDFSTNSVWLTFSIKSSGTTDTVGAQEITITQEAG